MSNQKYTTSYLVLLVCVFSACGLSMVFTVAFWSSMGATLVSCLLLSATGCVFEVSKFYALPTFLEYKRQQQWGRAGLSLGMFGILSFISMLAGIYALQHNLSLNAQTAKVQSTQYQLVLASVATQEQKVKNLLSLAEQDSKSGYRQRAKDTLNTVNKEQDYLNQLKFELLNYSDAKPKTTVNIPFVNQSKADSLVFLLGALLEVTTIFLLCLFRKKRDIKVTKQAPEKSSCVTSVAAKLTPVQQKHKNSSKLDKKEKYDEVVNNIKNQIWAPTQRVVKNAANIGSKTVAEFFVRMEKEGVIVKSQGNRYKLAQAA